MSKIDRNQSCISQLRRLFKVKRSNNIIENGPLWIGYSELFFKVNVQVFFCFSWHQKMRKTKEANYFHCYIQYTSFTCEFIHTLCSFNNKVFISLCVNPKPRTSSLNTSIVSSSVWQNSSAAEFIANHMFNLHHEVATLKNIRHFCHPEKKTG